MAAELCAALPGAAVEISQSGTGLHIFGTGAVPEHGCKNIPLGLEFYHEGRFAALTGQGAVGDIMTDCTALLPALVSRFFPMGAPRQAPTNGRMRRLPNGTARPTTTT